MQGVRNNNELRQDYNDRRENWDTDPEEHHGKWTSSNQTTNFHDDSSSRGSSGEGLAAKVKGMMGGMGGNRGSRDYDDSYDSRSMNRPGPGQGGLGAKVKGMMGGMGGNRNRDVHDNSRWQGRSPKTTRRGGAPMGTDLTIDFGGEYDMDDQGLDYSQSNDLNRNGVPDNMERRHGWDDRNRDGIPDALERTSRQRPSYGSSSYHPSSYGASSYHPSSYGASGYHPSSYGSRSYHPSSYGASSYQPSSYGPSTYTTGTQFGTQHLYGDDYHYDPSHNQTSSYGGAYSTSSYGRDYDDFESTPRSTQWQTQSFNRPTSFSGRNKTTSRGSSSLGNQPMADIYELGNDFTIELDLPGYTQQNVEMKLFGTELVITCNPTTASKVTSYIVNERTSTRQMKRVINLPPTADSKRINAQLSNGVLKITIPKVTPQTILPTGSTTTGTTGTTGTISNLTGSTGTTTTAL